MPQDIIGFLIQLPILAIFVWWVSRSNDRWDKNNEQWRVYLSERNGKLERSLEKMTGAIDRFHERLDKTR